MHERAFHSATAYNIINSVIGFECIKVANSVCRLLFFFVFASGFGGGVPFYFRRDAWRLTVYCVVVVDSVSLKHTLMRKFNLVSTRCLRGVCCSASQSTYYTRLSGVPHIICLACVFAMGSICCPLSLVIR